MVDLGAIILNTSVKLVEKWMKAYSLPEDFFVSVNLSAPEIERLNLVEDVSRLIREAGLPRKCLKLEVTESDVMRDPQASARVLEALRDAGAGIALDDFGTGFSSLSYLAKLPFDTLKIDRSFVNTMKSEISSEKIVRSILTLGRDLGLDVVAEGVEDMGLADRLSALGCQMGQGWGFAKALTPAEAEAYLVASLEKRRHEVDQRIKPVRIRPYRPCRTGAPDRCRCWPGRASTYVPDRRRTAIPGWPARSATHWRRSRFPVALNPNRRNRAR